MDVKTYQDWTLRYALRSVPGVSEVNAWGGQSKQYAIELDPVALRRYGLTVHDVVQRVADNNTNFGGGYIEHAEEQYTVRGLGRYSHPADLQNVVVLAREGVPVLLRDIGKVTESPILRYGATLSETHEVVSATVITLKGENGRSAIERIKARLAKMHLPEGYRLRAFYDQSEIINGTIHTVRRNLLEAGLLVTRRPAAVSGRHPRGAHRRRHDSALHALRLHRHGHLRSVRQSDEPRRNRLRHDRGRLGRHDRELRPSAGEPKREAEFAGLGEGRLAGSRAPHSVRSRDHHRRLPADLHPSGAGRPDVPAHGHHRLLGSPWLPDTGADRRPDAVQLSPQSKNGKSPELQREMVWRIAPRLFRARSMLRSPGGEFSSRSRSSWSARHSSP